MVETTVLLMCLVKKKHFRQEEYGNNYNNDGFVFEESVPCYLTYYLDREYPDRSYNGITKQRNQPNKSNKCFLSTREQAAKLKRRRVKMKKSVIKGMTNILSSSRKKTTRFLRSCRKVVLRYTFQE